MPRLTNSLPKYRKHKASGQAFVELNGRRHYLGPHGTQASKREYDRLVAEWLQHGRQLTVGPQGELLTVVELIVAYVHHARGYYRKDGKPTSEVEAIRLSLRPVKELYGRHPCVEFGPTALKVVRQKMMDEGLSRKLINQRIGRVKRMFKWGAESELIPASIRQALEMVEGLKCGRTEARETAPIKPVDDSVVDATLPFVEDATRPLTAAGRTLYLAPDGPRSQQRGLELSSSFAQNTAPRQRPGYLYWPAGAGDLTAIFGSRSSGALLPTVRL